MQLQLAEVHLRHPEAVPRSSPGLGLSKLAGSWEEEPAVQPHRAQSQVGSRGKSDGSWDGATQRAAPSHHLGFTPSSLCPSVPGQNSGLG